MTNQNDEVVFSVKSGIKDVSITHLFGNTEQLNIVSPKIEELKRTLKSTITIDEKTLYDFFASFEFLNHTKDSRSKIILYDSNYRVNNEFLQLKNLLSITSLNFELISTNVVKRTIDKMMIEDEQVKFSDIFGLDDIVSQFKEIGQLITNAKYYNEKGINIPNGILLSGEPGVGKTLTVRAFVNEFNLRLIEPHKVDGDFGSKSNGIDWEATFNRARYSKPCVVFIDEIDKINIDAQLLKEIDGKIRNNNILVIACANKINNLNPALLRPGRFDRKIHFQPITEETKAIILLKLLEKRNIKHNLDFDYIIELMGDANGAYIESYVNESKIKMEFGQTDILTNHILLESIELINEGYSTKTDISEDNEERTMVHEAGHAVVALALYGKDAVTKIDARGTYYYGGKVQLSSKIPFSSQTEILNRVKIALGGLVAEKFIYKEAGFGASSDINSAIQLLQSMIVNHATISIDNAGTLMFRTGFSEFGTEKSKDKAIDLAQKLLKEVEEEVEKIILENKDLLNKIVQSLKQKPLLLRDDIYNLYDNTTLLYQEANQNQIFLTKK